MLEQRGTAALAVTVKKLQRHMHTRLLQAGGSTLRQRLASSSGEGGGSMIIDVQLEDWPRSSVVRSVRAGYCVMTWR